MNYVVADALKMHIKIRPVGGDGEKMESTREKVIRVLRNKWDAATEVTTIKGDGNCVNIMERQKRLNVLKRRENKLFIVLFSADSRGVWNMNTLR